MSSSLRFWNWIAQRYAKQPIADEVSYEKKLEVTRSYFTADMYVLEFGCGTGSTAILHAHLVKHIHALDFSAKMIAIAKAKAEQAGVCNIHFEVATIEEIQLLDESLDAVLGLSILHLLENKTTVLAKVYRLLKPDGILVTSTSCMGSSSRLLRSVLSCGSFLGVLPHIGFFTEDELVASLEAAGFTIDYVWQPAPAKAIFIVAKKPLNPHGDLGAG